MRQLCIQTKSTVCSLCSISICNLSFFSFFHSLVPSAGLVLTVPVPGDCLLLLYEGGACGGRTHQAKS